MYTIMNQSLQCPGIALLTKKGVHSSIEFILCILIRANKNVLNMHKNTLKK